MDAARGQGNRGGGTHPKTNLPRPLRGADGWPMVGCRSCVRARGHAATGGLGHRHHEATAHAIDARPATYSPASRPSPPAATAVSRPGRETRSVRPSPSTANTRIYRSERKKVVNPRPQG